MVFSNTPCTDKLPVWVSCVSVLFSLLFLSFKGNAQHQFVFYHMDQVPQAGLLNPGYLPDQKLYVGLPLVSGAALSFASNGFTYNEVYPGNDFTFEAIDFAALADRSRNTNHLFSTVESQLFGFGLRLGQGFLSIGATERADFNGFHPAGFMQLLSDVQQNSTGMTPYELSRFDVNGTHSRSFSLGYAHQLERLSAGIRLHYLTGISNIWTINRGIRLSDNGDGDFFEVENELYFLSAGLNGSADRSLSDYLRGSGNRGFGIDLGLVYRLSDQIELSASALNLGLIRWNNRISYRKVDDELSQFSTDDLNALEDEFKEIIDDLVNGVSADGEVRYQTPLAQRYYLGGRYYLDAQSSLGLLFNTRVAGGRVNWGTSLSGSTKVGEILELSLAYSLFPHHYFNLGGGFSIDLGPVQFYAASDNLLTFFRWKNAHSAQAQVGINLNFGKIKPESSTPEPVVEADILPDITPPPVPEPEPPPARDPSPSTYAVVDDPFGPVSESQAVYLSAAPSANSTVLLHGAVREAVSRKLLKSIVLELYALENNGERTLVYANGFYSGRFSVPMRRGKAHLVIVNKHGYLPEEVILSTENLEEQEMIEREFTLSPKPTEEPAVTAAETRETRQDPPVAAQTADEKKTEITEAPRPVQTKSLFELTKATSFRRGPTHKTGVILRFSPGDRVELLEKHDRWWWRVRFRGRTGYVKAFLLVPVE